MFLWMRSLFGSRVQVFFVLCPRVLTIVSCIVLSRSSLSLIRSWSDDRGRFLQCECNYRGKVFCVACVYAPNRNPEREEFYDDVCERVDPSVLTVLCGDFNAVFDRLLDRVGSDPADTVRRARWPWLTFFHLVV